MRTITEQICVSESTIRYIGHEDIMYIVEVRIDQQRSVQKKTVELHYLLEVFAEKSQAIWRVPHALLRSEEFSSIQELGQEEWLLDNDKSPVMPPNFP